MNANGKIKISIVLIAYGVLCLLTAFILSFDVKEMPTRSIPVSGGEYGPITTESDNSVVEIGLYHKVPVQNWNAIEVTVLDANRQYLFSFADEVWHEQGRDSDGYWVEDDSNISMEITFPKAGDYYLQINSENPALKNGQIQVSSAVEMGSNLIFLWLGWISLILGMVLKFYDKSK